MTKKSLCIFLWMLCAYIAGAQTPTFAKKIGSQVEIENEQVIVRRNVHPAHAITPMHSHRAGIVVYLTDVNERSTAPNGSSKVVAHKTGEVVWAPARQHRLENLS